MESEDEAIPRNAVCCAGSGKVFVFCRNFDKGTWENVAGDQKTCNVQFLSYQNKEGATKIIFRVMPDSSQDREPCFHFHLPELIKDVPYDKEARFLQVAITNHQKLFGVKFDEDVKGERLVAKLRNKLTIVAEELKARTAVHQNQAADQAKQRTPNPTAPVPTSTRLPEPVIENIKRSRSETDAEPGTVGVATPGTPGSVGVATPGTPGSVGGATPGSVGVATPGSVGVATPGSATPGSVGGATPGAMSHDAMRNGLPATPLGRQRTDIPAHPVHAPADRLDRRAPMDMGGPGVVRRPVGVPIPDAAHDLRQVMKLPPSMQPEGLSSLMPPPSLSSDGLLRQLADALNEGDSNKATEMAKLIAGFHEDREKENKKICFAVDAFDRPPVKNEVLRLKINIEFQNPKKSSIRYFFDKEENVTESSDFSYLQHLVYTKLHIPKNCQRWIVGEQLVQDLHHSLKNYGICTDGDLFLYVLHPKKVKVSQEELYTIRAAAAPNAPNAPPPGPDEYHHRQQPAVLTQPYGSYDPHGHSVRPESNTQWPHHVHGGPGLIPRGTADDWAAQPMDRPPGAGSFPDGGVGGGVGEGGGGGGPISRRSQRHGIPAHAFMEGGGGRGGGGRGRGEDQMMMVEDVEEQQHVAAAFVPVPATRKKSEEKKVEVGWICPLCTLVNKPQRPGCEACTTPRPNDYVVPPDMPPDERERNRMDNEMQNELLLNQLMEDEKKQKERDREKGFREMKAADEVALIPNKEPFDCPICFEPCEPGEGMVLRNCLHEFCKDCLHDHIVASREAEIKCPFDDGDYTCDAIITEREIRALVTEEELDEVYRRCLREAESAAANSFHCRSPNCPGFCFYEDEVNNFHCPICRKTNCLLCKAIHEGMNCQEYQEDIKRRAMNDEAAQATQAMLDQLVQNGDAMHCPQCRVVVQKKDGCDWIRCSMCKTEICWATKGPRWGPKGHGDITGGCKCRVGGKRCHPLCRNCH